MNKLIVNTCKGPVEGVPIGFWRDYNNCIGGLCSVTAFLSIPYAKPPVGDLRWQPPQEIDPWTDVRPCQLHKAAVQGEFYEGSWGYNVETIGESEDCLYVDVYTPADLEVINKTGMAGSEKGSKSDCSNAGGKLPVMVWVHGGAYEAGSSLIPCYDPTQLASKGVVVVSVEYRVGVFGFLAHPLLTEEAANRTATRDIIDLEGTATAGNYGLLDVYAALKWVRENIEAFGGDAENITAFGQSCAGNIMSYLLTMPVTKGLVDKVIIESGTGDPMLPVSLEQGGKMAGELAERLGTGTLDELRAADSADVLAKAMELLAEKNYRWEPVIDGTVMKRHVFDMFREGEFFDMPVIISTTAQDTPLAFGPDRPQFHTTEDMVSFLTDWIGGSCSETGSALWSDADSKRMLELFDVNKAADPEQMYRLVNNVVSYFQSDVRARYFARKLSETNANPVYVTQWERVPNGWKPEGMGAFHEMELAYLYNNVFLDYPDPKWTDYDWALSEEIQNRWIAFAKTGNPNPDDDSHLSWPSYTEENEKFFVFGEEQIELRENSKEAFALCLKMMNALYDGLK